MLPANFLGRSRLFLGGLGLISVLIPTLLWANQSPVLGSRLRYLMAHQPPSVSLDIQLRFHEAPSAGLLQALEESGVQFRAQPQIEGLARRGASERLDIPARADARQIRALAGRADIARIEACWRPAMEMPLYRTREMVGAENGAWDEQDSQGRALLGEGTLIADIDSGIDLLHPDFWFADGDTVDFLDLDLSGGYSAGDGVDLNNNGSLDAGENLEVHDAPGTAPGMNSGLQQDIDHFYADTNASGSRDYGLGFSESDPAFGEPLFRLLDPNGNGVLDAGEQLVALSTPKVRAVYETDGTIRRRGVDLMQNEGDHSNHGTPVMGIVAGASPGTRFGGVAPAAELLSLNIFYGSGFASTPMDERMLFAASEGADVVLVELGGWVWTFLDGSSPEELLLNDLATQGIAAVVPAGNLATGGMHWQPTLGASDQSSVQDTLRAVSPGALITKIQGHFHWQDSKSDSIEITLTSPSGSTFRLDGPDGTNTDGVFQVWRATDRSPRATKRVDYEITSPLGLTALDGDWLFTLVREGSESSSTIVHAMTSDNQGGWFGNATWTKPSGDNTVTWPATADSAITVAAYNPASGGPNFFSGRGIRVDGHWLMDVAAPGSVTYSSFNEASRNNVPGGYGSFGGTSAAGPHVAGAVALLKQWNPALTHGELRQLLRQGAVEDAQTGATPGQRWGYGKLNVYESLRVARTAVPGLPLSGLLMAPNFPNPFNPQTTLQFELPRAGEAVVRLFDLRGRVVRTWELGELEAGSHQLRWDGRDAAGRATSSGVYLAQVELDAAVAARKISLIR